MYEFSVLMSLYFKEAPINLEECLNSLSIQTLMPNEIIIVFDGPLSEELTLVVDKWESLLPIKTIKLQENVGLGKALNVGLEYCQHDLVARMDTDDICFEDRFEKQIKQFQEDSNLTICGSHIFEFNGENNEIISHRKVPLVHKDIVESCIKINPFNHMTVMYKKSDILSVGGYKHFPWMEDWFLWLRLLANGYKAINIDDNLVKARTGLSMIKRRSGIAYVKSEWNISKVKVSLGLTSMPRAFIIFLYRALPRLLPKWMLYIVYKISRGKYE